jgi:hypothetical protein
MADFPMKIFISANRAIHAGRFLFLDHIDEFRMRAKRIGLVRRQLRDIGWQMKILLNLAPWGAIGLLVAFLFLRKMGVI